MTQKIRMELLNLLGKPVSVTFRSGEFITNKNLEYFLPVDYRNLITYAESFAYEVTVESNRINIRRY